MRTQNNVFSEDVLIPYFGKETVLLGIEIGVSTGVGSLGMLSRLPNLTLYCVDSWEHRHLEPYEANLPQEVHDQVYIDAINRLSVYSDRAQILRKRSDIAIEMVPKVVDFIFIDGHHEYHQVLRDIRNYAPRVRKGGIVAGHDYRQVPDVTKAVEECYPIQRLRQAEDFIWWTIQQ